MDIRELGKLMVYAGGALAFVGAVLYFGARFGLGRLPGDIHFSKGNFTVSFPLVTCILLSIVLTVIMNLVSKR